MHALQDVTPSGGGHLEAQKDEPKGRPVQLGARSGVLTPDWSGLVTPDRPSSSTGRFLGNHFALRGVLHQ